MRLWNVTMHSQSPIYCHVLNIFVWIRLLICVDLSLYYLCVFLFFYSSKIYWYGCKLVWVNVYTFHKNKISGSSTVDCFIWIVHCVKVSLMIRIIYLSNKCICKRFTGYAQRAPSKAGDLGILFCRMVSVTVIQILAILVKM